MNKLGKRSIRPTFIGVTIGYIMYIRHAYEAGRIGWQMHAVMGRSDAITQHTTKQHQLATNSNAIDMREFILCAAGVVGINRFRSVIGSKELETIVEQHHYSALCVIQKHRIVVLSAADGQVHTLRAHDHTIRNHSATQQLFSLTTRFAPTILKRWWCSVPHENMWKSRTFQTSTKINLNFVGRPNIKLLIMFFCFNSLQKVVTDKTSPEKQPRDRENQVLVTKKT